MERGGAHCRNIEFRIIPVIQDELDQFRAVVVRGHVVGVETNQLRIVFASVSMALANIVGCYGPQIHGEAEDELENEMLLV